MPASFASSSPTTEKKSVARVLVVEDHQEIGTLMQLALSRSLIDATVITTGEEALTRLATESYDLILLDIDLPGIDGLEVGRRLQANGRLRSIPVIFVSGLTSKENKAEAERLGAVEFVEKPIQLLPFLARIMGHLKLKLNAGQPVRALWPTPTL